MRNSNQTAVRKLSVKSLKNNRTRNIFIILAVILTSMMFTVIFSLFAGIQQVTQESTMREVGGRFHAGLKGITTEQYEKIKKDSLIKRSNYDILIGFADNILKRSTEVRYLPFPEELKDYFISLEEGHMPEKEDEIVVDTIVLDELGKPYALGEKIPLTITFFGETFEKEFTVSGWYTGDYVSHASSVFVSEDFWHGLKGNKTEEDFISWAEERPESKNIGLLNVNLFFDKASSIEEKVKTVITNAGYIPQEEINYGVNWAYMTSRMESVDPFTAVILVVAVMVIFLTGYLIIYNIFQISVIDDIRFYGLLKTIGMTKKQLRKLIIRQAEILSAVGIPIGLLMGFVVGKATLPLMMSIGEYGNAETDLKFSLFIFLFGALFSAATVFFSSIKPGKIAGSISPVEAVKYTERSVVKQRAVRHQRHFSLLSMAVANLKRNKKKTIVVVAAVSFSIILLTMVMTAVGSFQIDSYLEERITGDIMIGSNVLFHEMNMAEYEIDEEYVELAESQEGILQRDEMWVGFGKSIKLEGAGLERYRKLDEEGKLYKDQYTEYTLKKILQEGGRLQGYVFGYSDYLLSSLKVIEGELDVAKFQKGEYALLTKFRGVEGVIEPSDNIYKPGDKLTVSSVTEDSEVHEVLNDNGETIAVDYTNLAEKEYEVMAIVELPYSYDLHRYYKNSTDVILPLKELGEDAGINNQCFARVYRIEEEHRAAFEAAVKNYSEKVNPLMSYASKETLKREFKGMVNVISVIGIALAGVLAFIGTLNFINAVFTGIISRKREFAMLQSIGMTGKQLRKMLIFEGISYVLIAGIISLIAGSLLARAVLSALNQVILFFEYRFQIVPFLILLPLLVLTAIVTPIISFQKLQKQSVVERLRES